MTKLAIILTLSLGVGDVVTPCGNAICVGPAGQDVKLGGTLLETRGVYLPDGGLAALRPVVPGAVLTLQGIQASGSVTTPDVVVSSLNTHTGSGNFFSVRNGSSAGDTGGTEVFGVSANGPVVPASAVGFEDAGTILVGTERVTTLLVATLVDAGAENVAGQLSVGGAAVLSASNKGTCTLDGGSPAQCDGLGVLAGSVCSCFTRGTTAASAYAVSSNLSSTTVTCTAANGKTDTVGYHCF